VFGFSNLCTSIAIARLLLRNAALVFNRYFIFSNYDGCEFS